MMKTNLSTHIVLLRLLLLLRSSQHQPVASPKILCQGLTAVGPLLQPQEVSLSRLSPPLPFSTSRTIFNTESLTLSPPFGSPHPTDPPHHKRFRHCPAAAPEFSKSHRRQPCRSQSGARQALLGHFPVTPGWLVSVNGQCRLRKATPPTLQLLPMSPATIAISPIAFHYCSDFRGV